MWVCGRFGNKEEIELDVAPSDVRPEPGLSILRYGLNPMGVPSNELYAEMMTDSGNNTFFPEQREIIKEYDELMSSNDMFAYCMPSTRQHLNEVIRDAFG